MKHLNDYICLIKSHCEAPDFEYEGQAYSLEEFAKGVCNHVNKYADGWDYETILENCANNEPFNYKNI